MVAQIAQDDPLVRSMVAAFPGPAFVVDRTGRLVVANGPARVILGETAEGRPLVLSLRQPGLVEAIADTAADGVARRARLVLPVVTQAEVFQAHAARLVEGSVLVTLLDVTEQEQAVQMRRDFVANVSHELRTPLTAMIGFIETLQGAARDDGAARARFLGIMAREAERMARLVRDLLHLSRVESEERVRPRDPVDVAGIVAQAAATLRTQAEGAGVALHLAGLGAPAMAPGDGDQLTQVFVNLIENAVKYGSTGGRVEVTLAGREAALLSVEVRDFGEGFDPVHIPRLTERFYRVDTHRSRERGGTGLGLAIVKHIVSRHRGQLRIRATPGEGASFTVFLPRS
jgi:two-component system phosphate regulon sensor histidine kinase PhoR